MAGEHQRLAQEVYAQVNRGVGDSMPQTPGLIGINCIAIEEADSGRGLKGVFVGTRVLAGQEQVATFETGSFFRSRAVGR